MSERAQHLRDVAAGVPSAFGPLGGAVACAGHLHCSTAAGMGPGCGVCLTAGTMGTQRNAAGVVVRCRWCE